MRHIFAETYYCDYSTITYLGLKKFCIKRDSRGFGTNNRRYLGTIKTKEYSARVTVHAFPAQFYEFLVKFKSGKVLKIETGSGNFSEKWEVIKEIISPMYEVTEIKEAQA